MSQAINAYYTITALSEFREKERLRAKARHDEAQALHNARREVKFEIAEKLIKRNRPTDEVVEDTAAVKNWMGKAFTGSIIKGQTVSIRNITIIFWKQKLSSIRTSL